MPRYRTPLEDYLDFLNLDRAAEEADTSARLQDLADTRTTHESMLKAEAAAGNFDLTADDIPGGVDQRDLPQLAERVRALRYLQSQADVNRAYAGEEASIREQFTQRQQERAAENQRIQRLSITGLLPLLDKAPRNDEYRKQVVGGPEGARSEYRQLKPGEDGQIKMQELADWLQLPPEVVQAQLSDEFSALKKERRQEARDARTEARAQRAESREAERERRQAAADKRRALADTISMTGTLVRSPELLGADIVDPNSDAARTAAAILSRKRLVAEEKGQKKQGESVFRDVMRGLDKQMAGGSLELPTDEESVKQFSESIRSMVARRKALRDVVRKSVPQFSDDFGIGDPEKAALDDMMQEQLRRYNSPSGQLNKRLTDLEQFFGVR